jgi:hypothetical protein
MDQQVVAIIANEEEVSRKIWLSRWRRLAAGQWSN